MKAFQRPSRMSGTTSAHPAIVNPMQRALIIGALGVVYGDICTSAISPELMREKVTIPERCRLGSFRRVHRRDDAG